MTDHNIITVTELGQFAPEIDTNAYDNPTLSGVISQASKIVSDYLEYSPFAEDLTEDKRATITTRGDLIIWPAKPPVQSVTGITIVRGTTTVSLGLTANGVNKYNIDYNKRKISYPYEEVTLQGTLLVNNFFALRNTDFLVRLAYRGGFEVSELPDSIRRAAVLVVKDLLGEKYNVGGASRISQGGISLQYDQFKGKSEFMKKAEMLLRPYVR